MTPVQHKLSILGIAVILLNCLPGMMHAQPVACDQINTSENATIIITNETTLLLDGEPLPSGTIIRVLYQGADGYHCGGYTTWIGEQTAIAAFGDDGDLPGFQIGEPYRFQLELPDGCTIDSVATTYRTDGIFSQQGSFAIDGISGIDSLRAVSADFDLQSPALLLTCTQQEVALSISSALPITNWAWSGPNDFSATSATPMVQLPGAYQVEARGENQCLATATVVVEQAPPLQIGEIQTMSAGSSQNNGEATATVSSGTPPFTFAWGTDPPQTGPTATDLATGSYPLTVEDANGCQVDTVVVIDNINTTTAPTLPGTFSLITPSSSQVQLHYAVPQPLSLHIDLINAGGQVLYSRQVRWTQEGYWTIAINDLHAGWYAIRLKSEGAQRSLPFIKP